MADSSSTIAQIAAYADEFQKVRQATTKQVDYAEALLADYDTQEVLRQLGIETTEVSNLLHHEINRVINYCHRQQPATVAQYEKISELFTLNELQRIFHQQFTDYSQLTKGQIKSLLKTPKKFKFVMEDYPQVLDSNYEYGIQKTTGADCGFIVYLKFYELLMIDIDIDQDIDDEDSLQEVIDLLSTGPSIDDQCQMTWALYKTPRGYHAFLMTLPIAYNNPLANKIMKHYNCDHFYRLSTFKNGFRVRLSKKSDDEKFISKFIKIVGNHEFISDKCAKLLKIHDFFLFQDHGCPKTLYEELTAGNLLIPTASGYYQSWLDLMRTNHELAHPDLKYAGFRNYVLDKMGETTETVRLLAPALKPGMHKPQRLINDSTIFYVAEDMLTRTFYICFEKLLMLDIDWYKLECNSDVDDSLTEQQIRDKQLEVMVNNITELTEKNPELTFRLYLSQGGVHAFLTSREADRDNDDDLQLMLDMGVDFNYIIYSHLRGWSVRLNRKQKEPRGQSIYSYYATIGTADEDPGQLKLVRAHELLAERFINVPPSLMFGG